MRGVSLCEQRLMVVSGWSSATWTYSGGGSQGYTSEARISDAVEVSACHCVDVAPRDPHDESKASPRSPVLVPCFSVKLIAKNGMCPWWGQSGPQFHLSLSLAHHHRVRGGGLMEHLATRVISRSTYKMSALLYTDPIQSNRLRCPTPPSYGHESAVKPLLSSSTFPHRVILWTEQPLFFTHSPLPHALCPI